MPLRMVQKPAQGLFVDFRYIETIIHSVLYHDYNHLFTKKTCI